MTYYFFGLTDTQDKKMYRFLKISALPFVVLFFMCGNASADHRFGLGWSQWGALDDFDVGSVQATYQFGEVESIWDLRFGFTGFYSEFDTFFIGFGAMKEWGIGQNWSWGIGFDAGYYDGSRGLDELDNEIEFYSRILLNWHVSQSGFLRLEFGHISNAGFGENNPGSENLGLTYNWAF